MPQQFKDRFILDSLKRTSRLGQSRPEFQLPRPRQSQRFGPAPCPGGPGKRAAAPSRGQTRWALEPSRMLAVGLLRQRLGHQRAAAQRPVRAIRADVGDGSDTQPPVKRGEKDAHGPGDFGQADHPLRFCVMSWREPSVHFKQPGMSATLVWGCVPAKVLSV